MCEYGLWVGVQGEAGAVGQFSHCSLSAKSQCSSEISYVRHVQHHGISQRCGYTEGSCGGGPEQFNTMASHSRDRGQHRHSASSAQCCEGLKMQGGRGGRVGWRGGVADSGEGQAVSSFAAKRPSDFHECP